MAVVQISRIQIRRGQANQGTGFPQLASGELGWAIDTQQLYIGNGAVSEGSPAVGNTRVLTQTDLSGTSNLLQQLQHIYKVNDVSVVTGPSANSPVQRSLQNRLDDSVSTIDFGTAGDGITDDTAAIQRAINQLFLNATTPAYSNTVSGTSKRVILQMPAGQFNISSTIYIPSYASLIGAGPDKTVIYYNPVSTITGATALNSYVITTTAATARMAGATVTGTGIPTGSTVQSVIAGTSITISAQATATGTSVNITVTLAGAAIQFVNDSSTIGNPSSITSTLGTTQPRNIIIKDLTIWTPTGKNTCLQLDAVKESIFENLRLQGDWNSSLNSLSRGIYMQAVSSIVTCERNIFKNIKFEKFSYAVSTLSDVRYNSFIDCFVTDAYQGFALGVGANGSSSGQQFGPRETEIVNCKFYNVRRQAVYVDLGTANITRDCKYINVGNNGAGNTGAVYPQVYFANYGNTSQNDYSDRASDLASSNLTVQYVPEVAGHGTYYLTGTRGVVLGFISSTPTLAFRLPCSTTVMGIPNSSVTYSISYIYKSSANSFTRRGVITISADIDNKQIQLTDDYDFAGVDSTGTNALILDFKGYFLDATSAIYTGAGGQSVISIGVYYTNNLNGDTGTMAYSYTANL
jgi:Pectate lyase superfamily protein/Major tropism determinant N-terminal domain